MKELVILLLEALFCGKPAAIKTPFQIVGILAEVLSDVELESGILLFVRNGDGIYQISLDMEQYPFELHFDREKLTLGMTVGNAIVNLG